jgi:serpin B
LVLTDALYFTAPWVVPFEQDRREGEFTRLNGSTVMTPLMHQVRVADRHGRGDGFAAAEIPYAGGEFSMLVIVPDEGRFPDVRARLSGELLRSIDATFGT